MERTQHQFGYQRVTKRYSWAMVACSGMGIGHKGMIYATKALGMTAVDLFENTKLVEKVNAEFKERKGDEVYEPMLPKGPPPGRDQLK